MSEPQPFEQALRDLEDRVRRLESGEVPLDEALRLFEEGVSLARACHDHLEEAERRVIALSRGETGLDESEVADPPSRG